MTPEVVGGLFDPARLSRGRLDAAIEVACPALWQRCASERGGIGRRVLRDALVCALAEALKITWAECLRRSRCGNPVGAAAPVYAAFQPLIDVFDGNAEWLAVPIGIDVALHRLSLGAPGSALEVQVELRLAIGHGVGRQVFHEFEADVVLPAKDLLSA